MNPGVVIMTVELSKLEADILLGFLGKTYKIRRKDEHAVALDLIIAKLKRVDGWSSDAYKAYIPCAGG